LNREQFAENLSKAVQEKGFDLYDIAAAITREIHSVRNYLKGEQTPTSKVIISLSNLLEVSPNILLRDCYLIKPEFDAEILAGMVNQGVRTKSTKTLIRYFYYQGMKYDGSGMGKRIRIIMKENDILADDVARAIHFSERTVKNILYKSTTSLPSIDNLLAICQFLNTSPHYLLQDDLKRREAGNMDIMLSCLTPSQLMLIHDTLSENE